MEIVESTIINVLNYSDSFASFPTQIKPDGYLFEPALDSDGEQPFAIPISFSEIRVANSQSNIFREGILRFDKDFEQDVYVKLGIRDWEEILSDADIRKILLKPTKSGLEKVVKITSSSLLERVRGMLIMLENTGMYDISIRVKDVVNKRYQELYNNQKKSDIIIAATVDEQNNEPKKPSEEEIAKIREEVSAQFKDEIAKQILELEQKHKDELKKAVKEAKQQAKAAANNTAE